MARGPGTPRLLREINDRVRELNGLLEELSPYGSWICECAHTDCLERIDMTLGEYETLRKAPNRFAVMPNERHVVPEVERVVEKTERYWVVEKVGAAANVATELAQTDD